jgi:hypothetical protein
LVSEDPRLRKLRKICLELPEVVSKYDRRPRRLSRPTQGVRVPASGGKTRPDPVARGQSTVLDRAMRECLACECHAMVMQKTDRLLGAPITRI